MKNGRGAAVATAVMEQHTSLYRIEFRRREFLELVEIAKPRMICHTGECISSPLTAS